MPVSISLHWWSCAYTVTVSFFNCSFFLGLLQVWLCPQKKIFGDNWNDFTGIFLKPNKQQNTERKVMPIEACRLGHIGTVDKIFINHSCYRDYRILKTKYCIAIII